MARIDPFNVSGDKIDYGKLIRDFGTKHIDTVKDLPDMKQFRRGNIFSHRDFDKFLADVKAKKKVSIVSGLNTSGSMHLGHKYNFDISLGLQKLFKIPVYIPLTDDEAYVTGKVEDQAQGLKNGKLIASQIYAMGFDKKLTRMYIHQLYTKIYNLAIKLSKRCTTNEIKAIYGFNDTTNPGLFFYPILQAADILLPQELEGPHRTLVSVAIDQDPHVRLSRDLAHRIGFIKPSVIHLRFLRGLKGSSKMSTSKVGSNISLDSDLKTAVKACNSALTGGRTTAEEQRRLGGDPDKSVVIEYLGAHFIDDDKEFEKLRSDYKAGKLLDGETKKMLSDHITKFLTDFQKKVESERKTVDKYLLKN